MSLIVIQRGHVPRTSGRTGAPGEQQFAIEAAEQTRKRIQGVGHAVRIIDADVPDTQYRGEAFFAIHYDSNPSAAARGASVGHQTAEGAKAGRLWKAHYTRNGWTGPFRGDNYTTNLAQYYGVRNAIEMGNRFALIVEAGFHSNPQDAALLRSPKGPDRVAIAIAATVVDLFGQRGECPTTPNVPAFPGVCQRGDHGTVVVGWQRQMLRRGYKPAQLGFTATPDGIFGPKMETSVACWQEMFNLTVDGIAGPQTWHSLLFDR